MTFAPSECNARDDARTTAGSWFQVGPLRAPRAARGWLRLSLVAITVMALLLAFVSRPVSGGQHVDSLVGHVAPEFALQSEVHGQLQSGVTSLSASHGSTRLLVFFYTLCSHCLTELAVVTQTQQTIAHAGDSGFVPIYINSPAENPATVVAYVSRVGIAAPVLLDRGGHVATRYGVAYFPTLVLVDGKGIVRATWTGEPDATVLVTAIRQADD